MWPPAEIGADRRRRRRSVAPARATREHGSAASDLRGCHESDLAVTWRHLAAAGYFLASNPANSFFYLITAVHGLHVLGGLVALGRAADRAWRGRDMGKLRLSVDLCTTYWHFLLFVWVVLFALINGWASDFAALCRELLT